MKDPTGLALAALLAGCTDYALDPVKTAHDPAPVIVVDPVRLDFGGTSGDQTSEGTVTVTNAGDAVLTVSGADVANSEAFGLVDAVGRIDLQPGDSVDLDLWYAPVNQQDEGLLQVASNDPDTPEAQVTLLGDGLFPHLVVDPDPYDFGDVVPGCGRTGTLTVSNDGDADLVVNDLLVTGADYALAADVSVPFTLSSGDEQEVPVLFEPAAEGEEPSGALWVSSNDPAGDVQVALDGTAADLSVVEDVFQQGLGPDAGVDYLFYVDQSGSMTDDKARLQGAALTFMEALEASGVDWQVGVATRDDGCHNGDLITPSTPDAATAFQTDIVGTSGIYTEAGLTVALNAIEAAGPGGCNDGMLRDGAKTAIVLVSDEPEQSPDTWQDLVAQILDLAPNAAISAIAGDMPDGCATATAGAGYYEATQATGGLFLSICADDWSEHATQLGTAYDGPITDTFVLSKAPLVDSLVVRVNGQVTDGWTYEAGTNAVVFDAAHVPVAASRIDASYYEAIGCDPQ